MRGLDHKAAVNYLRQTPNTVWLRFSRPRPQSDEDEDSEEEQEEYQAPIMQRKTVSCIIKMTPK